MQWFEIAKKRMQDLGITQPQLEPVMGVSANAISHYITGRREPSTKQLVGLAGKLHLSMDQLFGLDPVAPPPAPPRSRINTEVLTRCILSAKQIAMGAHDEALAVATLYHLATEGGTTNASAGGMETPEQLAQKHLAMQAGGAVKHERKPVKLVSGKRR